MEVVLNNEPLFYRRFFGKTCQNFELGQHLCPVSPDLLGFAYIAEVLNQFWKIGKPQNMSELNQKFCMIWALKSKRFMSKLE